MSNIYVVFITANDLKKRVSAVVSEVKTQKKVFSYELLDDMLLSINGTLTT